MRAPTSGGEAPRVTFLVRSGDDEFATELALASLSAEYQLGVDADAYEIIVVGPAPSEAVATRVGEQCRPTPKWIASEEADGWILAGARRAQGELVCSVGAPGAASSTLVSSLFAALDAYDAPSVAIRTLRTACEVRDDAERWLHSHGPPDSSSLIRSANPDLEWLDAVPAPENVATRREVLLHHGAAAGRLVSPSELFTTPGAERVKLVGDAFVLPSLSTAQAGSDGVSVDPALGYFGLVVRPEIAAKPRRDRFSRRKRPFVSVIVIAHDMRREVPRTLRSLLPPYQRDIGTDEYEIVVIENGSRDPLHEKDVSSLGPNISYHLLEDAPPSPARAINVGVSRTRGEAIAIVIDGACLLSPGVLAESLFAWRVFPSPVVGTRYFVLGSGLQRDAALHGYDAEVEDGLLRSIEWPADGYRLFEVSSPLTDGGTSEHWLGGWFESNCLFMPRRVFERIGGCDERFDLPGGGGLIVDVFRQACELDGVDPVQLIGEGVFHQIHGGVTSNTTKEDVAKKKARYIEQYESIRGRAVGAPDKNFYFMGRLNHPACRWKMRG